MDGELQSPDADAVTVLLEDAEEAEDSASNGSYKSSVGEQAYQRTGQFIQI